MSHSYKSAEDHAIDIVTALNKSPDREASRAAICHMTGQTHGQFIQGVAWLRDANEFLANNQIAFHAMHRGPGIGWVYRITDLADDDVLHHQRMRVREMIRRSQRNDIGALAGLENALFSKGDLQSAREVMKFRYDWNRVIEAGKELEARLDLVLVEPDGEETHTG